MMVKNIQQNNFTKYLKTDNMDGLTQFCIVALLYCIADALYKIKNKMK